MAAAVPARRGTWRRRRWLALVVAVLLAAFPAWTLGGPALADAFADRYATAAPEGGLPLEERHAFLALAAARDVTPPGPGDEVRHAHASATLPELREALSGAYHSIEGDMGLHGDTAVMRHDVRDPVALTFAEWFEVVAAAEFEVIKLDLKRDKVGPLIEAIREALERTGVDERRLKLNVDAFEGPGAYEGFSWQERLYTRVALRLEVDDAVVLARAFPGATISLSAWVGPTPPGARYTADDIERFTAALEELREATEAPLVVSGRWDLLTPEFVSAMATEGARVDVWNAPEIAVPDDPALEVRRLRERYGDALGVIDLRAARSS